MAMQQVDKNFLDDVYDTLMKNTQYKVRDFTKYKDVYVDIEKGYIKIGKRKLILVDNSCKTKYNNNLTNREV
tara:strand:+ start:873 stop:1088 length:216 start_codon:yes stop_codon:yes gene_type:complete